nr:DNA-binding protein [Pseudosporangium ferrugineum]
MGPQEICRRLEGVSRRQTAATMSRPDFPVPVARLSQGRVWLADDVEKWLTKHRP